MGKQVTIIMYHFVRDLEHSRFPEIKGVTVNQFKEQIEYLLKYYHIITIEELIASVNDKSITLPPNALLLTFDDGYIDHFTNVFPILDKKKIQGSFFPPAKAIQESQVLDVNKIHFILASVPDKSKIIKFIFSMLDRYREEYSLEENKKYYERISVPNRFDEKDVIFIKRILQRELPERLRHEIVDKLFKKYVTADEKAFSKELYMSMDQLQWMCQIGMHIGSHGYDHYWLDTLTKEDQEREIDLSLTFLSQIIGEVRNWVISYPFGSFNDSLISLLKGKRCAIGLTTEVNIADMDRDDPLMLPRLDTNDLPKDRNALPNKWTMRIMEKK